MLEDLIYFVGLSNNNIISLSEKILKNCILQKKVTKYAKVHGIREKTSCELELVGKPKMESIHKNSEEYKPIWPKKRKK